MKHVFIIDIIVNYADVSMVDFLGRRASVIVHVCEMFGSNARVDSESYVAVHCNGS
jgi:hypothetical protein